MAENDREKTVNKFETLKAHILPLSKADEFYDAKNEWKLIDIYVDDEFDHCPCGQKIKEICIIKNVLNKNKTYVGNVCIKQFLEIDTGNAFQGLRKIITDRGANCNHDLIVHAYQFGYIYDNEYKFLMDTVLKRSLSFKQKEWKRKINNRIVRQTVVKKKPPKESEGFDL